MQKSEGDLGVELGEIFKIGVRLLDIRKALKYPVHQFIVIVNLTSALLALCDGSRALLILNAREASVKPHFPHGVI